MKQAFLDRWVSSFGPAYDTQALADIPWFTASPGVKVMQAVIDGLVPQGSSVIDLGCGPGMDAVFLASSGAQVTAVDLSASALAKARELAKWAGVTIETVEASILDTGLPDNSADIINDSFIFHNVRDESRQPYADEIHRLLRPGGLFLLTSFSDRMVAGSGPRRITSGELLASFPAEQFECQHLELFPNLPTPARPEQWHWFATFKAIAPKAGQ